MRSHKKSAIVRQLLLDAHNYAQNVFGNRSLYELLRDLWWSASVEKNASGKREVVTRFVKCTEFPKARASNGIQN